MVKVFCFSLRKQECDWVVPLTEYRKFVRTLSRGNLALVINTNGWESLGCFGKRGKKRKNLGRLYFFLQNFHLDTFRWILSRITSGFPTKMVRDVREIFFFSDRVECVNQCVSRYPSYFRGYYMKASDCPGATLRNASLTDGDVICCIFDTTIVPSIPQNVSVSREVYLAMVGDTTRTRALYPFYMKALSTADIIGNKLEIAAFTAQVSTKIKSLDGCFITWEKHKKVHKMSLKVTMRKEQGIAERWE